MDLGHRSCHERRELGRDPAREVTLRRRPWFRESVVRRQTSELAGGHGLEHTQAQPPAQVQLVVSADDQRDDRGTCPQREVGDSRAQPADLAERRRRSNLWKEREDATGIDDLPSCDDVLLEAARPAPGPDRMIPPMRVSANRRRRER